MNHEFSGENPAEKTEKTEWETLGDEVAFSDENDANERDENPEKNKYLEFVEENYGDKLETIVDNACFDGGDRTNPDCYVISMKLDKFLSEDEQFAAIDARTKGESLPTEIREKIAEELSRKIETSELKDKIESGDLFLRTRRLDTLAGRETDKLSEEDENLEELLWCADDKFGESEEGKALISDFDYLKKTYPIGDEKVLPTLAQHMLHMVESGQTSVDELLDDPLLRKKHFKSLVENERGTLQVGGEIRQMWDADQEFYDSFEYRMCLADYAREKPDVYENVDSKEVEKLTGEFLSEFSDEDIEEILRNYERNPRKGDEFLYRKLLPVLGLDENPPALKYGPAKNHEGGFYTRHNHSLTICEDTIKKGKSGDQPVLKTSSILDLFRPKKVDDKKFYRMNVVAHEMWHAHQWAGKNVDESRREKYQENFVYYMTAQNGYNSYRTQLIENEAWSFGNKFEARCREKYKGRKK